MSTLTFPHIHPGSFKFFKSSNVLHLNFPQIRIRHPPVCCTKSTPWEPSLPVTYAPTETAADNLLKKTTNIFDTLSSENTAEVALTSAKELTNTSNQPLVQLQFLKWPMWLLGPSLLLATGMIPTLWLPISSIFLGPNIASLLSLIGLDCIFNLGATLFLLMADSCARPKQPTQASKSKAPFTYQFWNMVATVTGFIIPLMMLYGSQKGFLQPQLSFLQPQPSFITSAVLLGPYFLLLFVQILTEMLTWHWQSPVWLVTPVVYEAYRVLQLMRGLKLGAELSAPAWIMHVIRGLVCWWVLILGVQLMRVAWFAGFTSRAPQQQTSAADS
ncbi:uncharacterized protein LOC121238567 [Juglans microcarpa x Juglans regia]|uniref:uncharacterized protein LOC121238567 n=1 Tax=Juglans microcarpa x Juglans regia TaxID=2249226 RepID=UPI001B7F65B2|nr:uncharacterized protein LOC121238567 [Juglans microcarpa x Juglans regia]XP_040991426.1 uncharacterized protein LOC121238567 [Juglans microcarpa x Juglans regia]XP_040991427.1 uncharacterized protein LOC121238567 [Juglans microcarpa x Juglans regia]XP_040991428.1 uncharacterized protein LOC121238567 [Juglans microcarpa x Juglans regia]